MTNKEKMVLVIVVLISTTFLVWLFKTGNELRDEEIIKQESYIEQLEIKDQELRIVYDSMIVENQKQRIKSDSLQKELVELKSSYNKIKSKYEKIHNIVNNMSIDEGINFISTAISKEDSLR